jgi:heavy metal translocating P-type ATPase
VEGHRILNRIVLALTLLGIAGGAAARFSGRGDLASYLWAGTILLALLPLAYSVLRSLLSGKMGVDLIALIAMAGALALGQYLPGAVIALMLSGGQALEALADSRARAELKALLDRSPRVVHRYRGESPEDAAIEAVRPGDLLLVKPGEVVPVDGLVAGETATLDESALTGEALPVARREGERVLSGTVNAGVPFRMRATATAGESTYAGIVRLVRQAQAAKAPLVRLADRYALVLLPVAVITAAAAWLVSGDPVRALAVMVVATPCPLILAAPIAIVSGISLSAKRGIIVKGGGALEMLGRGSVLVLDKTGTVTGGAMVLEHVETFGEESPDEVLRLAASLDQASHHVLAEAILRAARDRGLSLSFPAEVVEEVGSGVRGKVEGREISLGKAEWVLGGGELPQAIRRLRRRSLLEGSSTVLVARDGAALGALLLEDPLRPDAPQTLRALRQAGFGKILLLTGDHVAVAESVGAALGVDRVLAERSPAEKVDAVLSARDEGVTVMVGDGINDAAALAAADVGVAMGARGASASSEAADLVLLVDRLDRLGEAVGIARRSRRIALQSIVAGMGLSFVAMAFAAAGSLPPLPGALIQEIIDVAVILNALRALREIPSWRRRDSAAVEVGRQFRDEHRRLLPEVKRIRGLADQLDTFPPGAAREELARMHLFLRDDLLPHEAAEDATAYPRVARLIGGKDPTATLSRAHLEIAHLVRVLGSLLEDLPPAGPGPEDLREFRRLLYGLDAILRLHFAQEEESYLALIETHSRRGEHAGSGGSGAAHLR